MIRLLFNFFNELAARLEFHGFVLDLIVALGVSLCIIFCIVIIGRLVDILEGYLLRLISHFFGQKIAVAFCNYLTFPGVMLHELAHAITIFFLGGKITKIRLFQVSPDGQLGYVNFITRGTKKRQYLQMSFGSCAPVVFGMVEIYFLRRILSHPEIAFGWRALLWYLLIAIACHMSMSGQDLKNYFRGILMLFPTVYAVVLLSQYFFFRY